jgi:predicted RNase H-like HicB family nuclease
MVQAERLISARTPHRCVARAYHVIVEKDEDGWYVGTVSELPGCHTQAKSLDQLRERVQKAIRAYIGEVSGDLSRNEVLAITYVEFPEGAKDSIVQEKLAKKGPLIALNLVKKEKVSPELGAKIAGMPLRDFLKYLSRHKVPVVEDGPMGRTR